MSLRFAICRDEGQGCDLLAGAVCRGRTEQPGFSLSLPRLVRAGRCEFRAPPGSLANCSACSMSVCTARLPGVSECTSAMPT
jgi:hypothetical protein